MIFKDFYGVYRDVDVDFSDEMQLYRNGMVHGGIVDIFRKGKGANEYLSGIDTHNGFQGKDSRLH